MTNRAQIPEFYKKYNRGNFYLLCHSFEIWIFINVMKAGNKISTIFQHDISKIMPAMPKNTQGHVV